MNDNKITFIEIFVRDNVVIKLNFESVGLNRS